MSLPKKSLLLSLKVIALLGTHRKRVPAPMGSHYILQGRCERELESEAIEQSERGPCGWGLYTSFRKRSIQKLSDFTHQEKLIRTYLLATMFDHQFPCYDRRLPPHAPQDLLSCPFVVYPTILRRCQPLRLAKPSIGCHGVCIKQEGLVFLRIFNTFVLFNVGDSPFIALESFDDRCF